MSNLRLIALKSYREYFFVSRTYNIHLQHSWKCHFFQHISFFNLLIFFIVGLNLTDTYAYSFKVTNIYFKALKVMESLFVLTFFIPAISLVILNVHQQIGF